MYHDRFARYIALVKSNRQTLAPQASHYSETSSCRSQPVVQGSMTEKEEEEWGIACTAIW